MSREERKKRWGFWETFVIGKQDNPMMKRLRMLQTPWFGIYLHFIYREDLDPVPHDHPWNFWRMVLRGGYVEYFFDDPIEGEPIVRYLGPWRPNRITVDQAHRITWVEPGTVSLVLVGKKQRSWGFWTPEDLSLVGDGYGWESRSWIDYRDALGLRPSEGVHSQDAPVVDAEGYHVWPDGRRTWPGPGPQPDRDGMTTEVARRILTILTDAVPPADPEILKPLPIEESIRRAKEQLTKGCDSGECSCLGHSMPGVRHMVPCCDQSHIDQTGLDSFPVPPPVAGASIGPAPAPGEPDAFDFED